MVRIHVPGGICAEGGSLPRGGRVGFVMDSLRDMRGTWIRGAEDGWVTYRLALCEMRAIVWM